MSWQEERDAVRLEYADYLEAVEAQVEDREDRAVYPHCDDLILHAPSLCWACDLYPERQALRIDMGIAFTGQAVGEAYSTAEVSALGALLHAQLPCPAEASRPLETIERWGPNVARTQEEQDAADAEWRKAMERWFP
jgi:hypothetical protein